GALAPSWYFRQRAQRRRAEVAEAVGEAVETLRDAVRIGLGIEESLRALARTGPLALRPALVQMERDIRLAGFEEGVERARERLREPLFDTLAVALLTSYRLGGRNLAQVLDGLSASVRGSVQVRREVRAQQAQNVLSARVIAALPVVLILVIRSTSPDYLEAFSRPAGQALLAGCLLSVAVGYTVMLRQAALPGQGRMLR
ncbi:MAG: type II secretion system F family protein, partial [Chloroflexi bacterium]|nr:type II secretion system F family protein [Chloroflexota bacterium]